MYSVREDCAKDFEGTMAAVAQMGYDGVEFAGYYDRTAEQVAEMLVKNGLKCAGTHTPYAAMLEDSFEKTVEFNKTIGSSFIIIPGLPEECKVSIEAWKKTAEFFNELAGKLAPHGMKIGYHNHAVEFKEIDGQYPWDAFFSVCSSDVVMQLDTGNAMISGVDVSPFFDKYPGRSVTLHLKEWTDKPGGAVIGEGVIDWKKILTLADTKGGTEWLIVEQESYPYPPLESARRCLENLDKIRTSM